MLKSPLILKQALYPTSSQLFCISDAGTAKLNYAIVPQTLMKRDDLTNYRFSITPYLDMHV